MVFTMAFLPGTGVGNFLTLHGSDFVFRAIGRPVGIVGSDDIGAADRVMEGGIDHARLHPFADLGLQHGVSAAAGNADPVAVVNATLVGIVRMNLEPVLVVPALVIGASCLGADVVLAEDSTGRKQ